MRHVGEPIAVVIAADRYAARDAADAVQVDYAPLQAVIGVDAALAEGAPRIHEELDSNVGLVLAHKTDGLDAAFAGADVIVEHTIHNQRLIHVPIETRGVVADWNPASDDLVVYSSTQVPHFLRTFLAIVCGVSEAKVRAIAPDVGGGFGAKLNAYAEEFIAAAASRKVGAPVKWIEGAPRRCWPPVTAVPRMRTSSWRPTATARCWACGCTTSRTTAPTCRC